jgi:hypothetical protein
MVILRQLNDGKKQTLWTAEGIETSHKERHQPVLRLPELQPCVTNKALAKSVLSKLF